MPNKGKKKKKEEEKEKSLSKTTKSAKMEWGFNINYSSTYPIFLDNQKWESDFD